MKAGEGKTSEKEYDLIMLYMWICFVQIPTASGQSANDIEDPEHYR